MARLLNTWAKGRYTFRRRGLGQPGLPDLVAVQASDHPLWPFCISVKGGRGPTPGQLLVRARGRASWEWWSEVCDWVPTDLSMLVGGWLIWRAERKWWLMMREVHARRWQGIVSVAWLDLQPRPAGLFLLEDFLRTVNVPEVLWVVQELRKEGGDAKQPQRGGTP